MDKTPGPVRVIIADDHPVFRFGLRMVLESEPGFSVIAEAGDGKEAVKLTRELNPDILLLDLSMPRHPGMDALRELSGMSLQVRTLILTATVEKNQILEALQHGARGIILKESATQLLRKSIQSVMAGEYWIGRDSVPELVRKIQEQAANSYGSDPSKKWRLTPRELQIVSAIVAGYTNKDIAQKFSLSEQTVKHHLTNIFDKLGVSNRLELALFSVNHRLVDCG